MQSDGFAAVSARVVEYLREHTPMQDWSVNRVDGGEQVHLHVAGQEIIGVGDRVPWEETFCRRVIEEGAGPVVSDALTDPDVSDLPMAGTVRAYTGLPIVASDGRMFGTLCGVGGDPLTGGEAIDLELIELLTDILGAHLSVARRAEDGERAVRVAEALAQADALTGLTNRRGWDSVLADAAVRASTYGDLAAVVVVDLDGLKRVNDAEGHEAGDALLRRAATALDQAAGDRETVARYGGDEFTILVEGVGLDGIEDRVDHFRDALLAADVQASFGWSHVSPGDEPADRAFVRADDAMYREKMQRHAVRRDPA